MGAQELIKTWERAGNDEIFSFDLGADKTNNGVSVNFLSFVE